MNKVWIVMRHDHKDYPNVNIICTVCATEELAEEALLWFESGASKTQEFWIEDHYLCTKKKNETLTKITSYSS